MSGYQCTSCSQTFQGQPRTTITGRTVCPACEERMQGLTAGLVGTGTAPGAIAVSGWFSRLRAARRRRE